MPFDIPFIQKKKSVSDLEEENELLTKQAENEELRLSIAQKQSLYKKLDDAGLTVRKDFGGSLKRAWTWLNKTK